MRIVNCAKKAKVMSDWMSPPHSTVTYRAIRYKKKDVSFKLWTCFRIQGGKGKGTTRGGAYF
jgi:hypothetical protein